MVRVVHRLKPEGHPAGITRKLGPWGVLVSVEGNGVGPREGANWMVRGPDTTCMAPPRHRGDEPRHDSRSS